MSRRTISPAGSARKIAPMRGGVLVALAAAMAIAASGASAATYCVPAHSGCVGSAQPTLSAAVTAANGTPEADDIVLGAGPFAGGVTGGSYPVHIHGAGTLATKIEGGGGTYGLYIGQTSSSIENLTIHELPGGHSIGLYLGGDAQRVAVDLRDNPVDGSTAVSLHGDGSFVDGAALNSLATTYADYGINVVGTGDALVSNVEAQGRYAMTTDGAGTKTLRFVRATGDIYTLNASADSTLLDESTVVGGPVVGYLFGGPNDIVTTLRHVTVSGGYVGAESDGHTSRVVLTNTAIVGGGPDPESADIELQQFFAGTARVEADYSFFRAGHVIYTAGPGIQYVPGIHNIDGADAKLLDVAHGDLRPRFDSPLIDAGDPVPGGGEPMSDLAGEFRAVNGRTDIGAYEYGRHAPTVSAAASALSAHTGEVITFTAATNDADPAEFPDVTWTFDDGTTARGLSVSHAFATPGPHTGSATATDPAGLTAAAPVSVTITAPILPAAKAPAFRFKRLKARKGVVAVALSCPVLATDCSGAIELRLAPQAEAKGVAARTVVLGRARYAIVHGAHKAIKVKLTKSARKRLRRAGRGLLVKVVAKPTGAKSTSKTVRLTGR